MRRLALGSLAGTILGLGWVLTLGLGTIRHTALAPSSEGRVGGSEHQSSAEIGSDAGVGSQPETIVDLTAANADRLASALAQYALELSDRSAKFAEQAARLEAGAPPREVIRSMQADGLLSVEVLARLGDRPLDARTGDARPSGDGRFRDPLRGERFDDRRERSRTAAEPDGGPPAPAMDPARLRAFVQEHLRDTIPEEARSMVDTDRFWAAMSEGPRGQRLRELVEAMDEDPDLGQAKLAEFRAALRVAQATGRLRRVLAVSDTGSAEIEDARQELLEAMGEQFDALTTVRELEIQRLSERLEVMQFQLRNDSNERDQTIQRHAEERFERLRQITRPRQPRD